jgi:hypothetical protein
LNQSMALTFCFRMIICENRLRSRIKSGTSFVGIMLQPRPLTASPTIPMVRDLQHPLQAGATISNHWTCP